MLHAHQLDARARQRLVGGQHVAIGSGDNGLCAIALADQHVIDVGGVVLVHAEAAGGVALGVEIHQQNPLANLPQSGGKIDRSCGFAHTALLIGHYNASCHADFLPV